MARKPKKAAPVRRSHKNAPQAKPTILQIIKGLRKANAELGKDFADLQGNYIKLDGEHGKMAAELGRERSEVATLRERLAGYLQEIGDLRRREGRTRLAVRQLSQFIVDIGHPPEVREIGKSAALGLGFGTGADTVGDVYSTLHNLPRDLPHDGDYRINVRTGMPPSTWRGVYGGKEEYRTASEVSEAVERRR